MTAGEALLYPVSQVDVVEINNQVVKACALFSPWNNNCLTNSKIRVIVQDGRNHLELTRKNTTSSFPSHQTHGWPAWLISLHLNILKRSKPG